MVEGREGGGRIEGKQKMGWKQRGEEGSYKRETPYQDAPPTHLEEEPAVVGGGAGSGEGLKDGV